MSTNLGVTTGTRQVTGKSQFTTCCFFCLQPTFKLLGRPCRWFLDLSGTSRCLQHITDNTSQRECPSATAPTRVKTLKTNRTARSDRVPLSRAKTQVTSILPSNSIATCTETRSCSIPASSFRMAVHSFKTRSTTFHTRQSWAYKRIFISGRACRAGTAAINAKMSTTRFRSKKI